MTFGVCQTERDDAAFAVRGLERIALPLIILAAAEYEHDKLFGRWCMCFSRVSSVVLLLFGVVCSCFACLGILDLVCACVKVATQVLF